MERSRYLLLAVVLGGVIASPTTSASHPPRSRPLNAAAPVQHTASHHAVQHRAVASVVRQTRVDTRHPAPRAPVVIRYVPPVVRVVAVYPITAPPRVVPVPVSIPYFVPVGLQPAQEVVTAPSAGFPPDWNWRPVESFAALSPRAERSGDSGQPQVRYYCPDAREYFPLVETCDSSWLKVIP